MPLTQSELRDLLTRTNSGTWQRRTTHSYQLPQPSADRADTERSIGNKTDALGEIDRAGGDGHAAKPHVDKLAEQAREAAKAASGDREQVAKALGRLVEREARDG